LRVLSSTNQILLHATEETALLNEICHIVIDTGGYAFVWVGYAEHDAQITVRLVAQYGALPGCRRFEQATLA
jgi:hypothetical protein